MFEYIYLSCFKNNFFLPVYCQVSKMIQFLILSPQRDNFTATVALKYLESRIKTRFRFSVSSRYFIIDPSVCIQWHVGDMIDDDFVLIMIIDPSVCIQRHMGDMMDDDLFSLRSLTLLYAFRDIWAIRLMMILFSLQIIAAMIVWAPLKMVQINEGVLLNVPMLMSSIS